MPTQHFTDRSYLSFYVFKQTLKTNGMNY
uniref:Uncharacterized protein n=1 Tax=Anguilla anguilla TaxID=7936 RepID=A0A0E9TXG4_ANGAN